MIIKILDTGYLNTGKTGNQLSDANRAGYDGSSTVNGFSLNVNSLSLAGGVNTERRPIVSTLTDVNTSLVSVNNRLISVTLVLDKDDSTSGYDNNQLFEMMRLERTEGVKLLYPSNVTDSKKSIVELLGASNTNGSFADGTPTDDEGTVSTTTPYLTGMVKNMRINDTPGGDKFTINFDFLLTG